MVLISYWGLVQQYGGDKHNPQKKLLRSNLSSQSTNPIGKAMHWRYGREEPEVFGGGSMQAICFFGTVLASLNRISLGDIAAEDPSEYDRAGRRAAAAELQRRLLGALLKGAGFGSK